MRFSDVLTWVGPCRLFADHQGLFLRPERENRMRKIYVLLIVSITMLCNSTTYATDVCGNVSGNWDFAGSPYYVICDAILPAGEMLEIEAGVVVQFMGSYKLDVFGNLQAVGTGSDSIFFTTDTLANPARWRGLRFRSGSDASFLSFCSVEYGEAAGVDSSLRGGGIYIENSSPTFHSVSVRYCRAGSHGGGIFLYQSSSTLDSCLVEGNVAEVYGGGISTESASPTLNNCEIRYNESGSDGGGIRNLWSSISISRCLIHHNVSGRWGGGLLCRGNTHVANSTISFNEAESYGSGVHLHHTSTAQLVNTIISHSYGIGIHFDDDTGTSVNYCDISENTASDFSGTPVSGFGLMTAVNENGDSCDAFSNIFMDPRFSDSLVDDYNLLSESPCIDAGDPTSPHDPDSTIAEMGAFYYPQPNLLTTPTSLDFGLIDLGTDSTMVISLYNPTILPMVVDSFANQNPVFTIDTTGFGTQFDSHATFNLLVTFYPSASGIFRDIIIIVAEIAGNDTIRIPLVGAAAIIPKSVDRLVVSIGAMNGIQLSWAPVTESINGFPLTNVSYIIYGSTSADGEFQPFGFTGETTYQHPFILNTQDRYFYYIEPFLNE